MKHTVTITHNVETSRTVVEQDGRPPLEGYEPRGLAGACEGAASYALIGFDVVVRRVGTAA